MNTKFLMTSSALLMALGGISLIFLPNEIVNYIGLNSAKSVPIVLQLLGAAYFAFAVLNWMAKESLIGGIYNRPIAFGNFTHFFVGGLVLIKGITVNKNMLVIGILCFLYIIFALFFGLLLFRHPIKNEVIKEINN